MRTQAAVLTATGRPLELVELETPALEAGQVLVEVVYSGVCGTQLLEARGHRGEDPWVPHCLGHEGSGVVREVGPGVTKVQPGDKVVLSWIKGLGADPRGARYRWGEVTVNAGGITTFQRHAVIAENRLTPLPDGVGMEDAALLGCAAATGLGVVMNVARPQPGESLAVFGAGGIGQCAIAAARLAGCEPVVAIDLNPEKLDLARRMGATATLDAAAGDLLDRLTALLGGGLDYAVEATGRPAVMACALAAVRPQGGAAVVVGNAHQGEELRLDPKQLNLGKRLLGTWGGDSHPDRDFPRYGRLLASGRLDLSPLRGRTYQLDQINRALDDLEAGRVARPLIACGER